MSDVMEKGPRTVVAKMKNITFFSDDTILIKNVRASYPHLDKPTAFVNADGTRGRETYSLVVLIPKTEEYAEVIEGLNKRINRVRRSSQIDRLPANMKCLRDGDLTEKPEEVGMWILSARETDPPALSDRRRNMIPNADATKVFYGGAWVNCLVSLWGQNNRAGQRVNANLRAVQFVRDDTPFGRGRISRKDLDDTFEDLGDDESGYDEDQEGEEAPF